MKNKNYYKKHQDIVKQEFLKLQNKCYLCGEPLSTYIESLPKSHLIVEKAQCQSCMTMVRVKNHSLQ